jgi:large conductance mechanosensitive channel
MDASIRRTADYQRKEAAMLAGFKKFIMQGNVVDLAVGVVVGAAFGALVKAFGDSFITPLIQVITGGGTKGGKFKISGAVFNYGAFITAIITFVLTMAVVYFVVVVPMNAAKARRARNEGDEEASNEEKMLALLERIAQK